MFLGTYLRKGIDGKGRVLLSAKFCKALGKEVIIVQGFEPYLCIYSEEVFGQIIEKLTTEDCQNSHLPNPLIKRIASGAIKVSFDKQGRIGIPKQFRGHAPFNKEKEIVILGVLDHLEIWDKETWEEKKTKEEEEVKRFAGRIAPIS